MAGCSRTHSCIRIFSFPLDLCGQFKANFNFFISYFVLHQELRSCVEGKKKKNTTKLNWLPEKGDVKLATVFFRADMWGLYV